MPPCLASVTKIYATHPKLKKQDVDTIFDWLKTQPHLPELKELQVILFLHSCNYETSQTKTTIENYFTLRTSSDLFQSADEDIVRRVLSTAFLDIFPKKTPEGYVVFLLGLLNPNPEKFNCNETLKVAIMVLCLYFHQYGPANGLVLLVDLRNTTFGHLFRMNDSAPTRLKGIHYVNTVPVTRHFITLGKQFLKKEIHEMIKSHTALDSLYEYIPKDCLPEEYGGIVEPRLKLHEENLENLLKNLDFFKWHDSQKVDESKRIRKTHRWFFRM